MVRLQAIADQYGLDKKDFSSFIMDNLLTHPAVKVGVTGIGIDPNAVLILCCRNRKLPFFQQ